MDIKEIKASASLPIIKEVKINIPLPTNIPSSIIIPNVALIVAESLNNNEQHYNEEISIEKTNSQMFEAIRSQEIPLRRSQMIRKSIIPSDYKTYLQESNIGININQFHFQKP